MSLQKDLVISWNHIIQLVVKKEKGTGRTLHLPLDLDSPQCFLLRFLRSVILITDNSQICSYETTNVQICSYETAAWPVYEGKWALFKAV